MAKRNAQGSGSIRERKPGLWEARYTLGRDPVTGKPIRKSVYGKSQKEVRKKLTSVTSAIDEGTYTEPSRLTFGQWLTIWAEEFCGAVKPRTKTLYEKTIDYRIRPYLGHIALFKLNPATIQKFYNDALAGNVEGKDAISAKTVRNLHGIIHKALQQAVEIGYLKVNPAGACVLPKAQKAQINPLDESQTQSFIEAIKRDPFQRLFLLALFTGMREGEILGLTWEAVDFSAGTINIFQQLQLHNGKYCLMAPKNGKPRIIAPASFVMDILKQERKEQAENRLKSGPLWVSSDFVFTDEVGQHMKRQTVYKHFKDIMASIGLPSIRFHDLRHSYAVAAIRAGDDIKTVSENLGHASVAFTLDIYGHVTDEMKKSSADRMQAYIDHLKVKN